MLRLPYPTNDCDEWYALQNINYSLVSQTLWLNLLCMSPYIYVCMCLAYMVILPTCYYTRNILKTMCFTDNIYDMSSHKKTHNTSIVTSNCIFFLNLSYFFIFCSNLNLKFIYFNLLNTKNTYFYNRFSYRYTNMYFYTRNSFCKGERSWP